MTLVIGLTGSIGTGKSTIADHLRALSIPVVDADLIAREVVEPGKKAYLGIVEAFGSDVLQADKTLDRSALGRIVFADRVKRDRLNAIIHPEIRQEIIRQRDELVKSGAACVVLDIPLLFESKLTDFVEKIIVVSVDADVQLKRILSRDNSTEEEAIQRMDAQIPVVEKAAQADAVIDNNGTIDASKRQLEQVLARWGIMSD